MAEITITQVEADALLAMEKHRQDEQKYEFPDMGGGISVPLVSANKRESFLLDVHRGRIDLKKVKFQNRARKVIVLVRLDIAGPIHRNPDDQEIPCPHLHVYREGYGDKWAYPIPAGRFKNLGDHFKALEDFMRYCNITKAPLIEGGLFT